MADILSASARKAIASALGECRRCQDKIEFLESCGVDCQERKLRLEHLKQMAETALELTEPGGKFGKTIG